MAFGCAQTILSEKKKVQETFNLGWYFVLEGEEEGKKRWGRERRRERTTEPRNIFSIYIENDHFWIMNNYNFLHYNFCLIAYNEGMLGLMSEEQANKGISILEKNLS